MKRMEGILAELAVLILSAVAVAVAQTIRQWLKAKMSTEQYSLVERIAEAAVWAVEQRGAGIFTSKKEAALSIVNDTLAKKGINAPAEAIDAAIESAVAVNLNFNRLVKEDVL